MSWDTWRALKPMSVSSFGDHWRANFHGPPSFPGSSRWVLFWQGELQEEEGNKSWRIRTLSTSCQSCPLFLQFNIHSRLFSFHPSTFRSDRLLRSSVKRLHFSSSLCKSVNTLCTNKHECVCPGTIVYFQYYFTSACFSPPFLSSTLSTPYSHCIVLKVINLGFVTE